MDTDPMIIDDRSITDLNMVGDIIENTDDKDSIDWYAEEMNQFRLTSYYSVYDDMMKEHFAYYDKNKEVTKEYLEERIYDAEEECVHNIELPSQWLCEHEWDARKHKHAIFAPGGALFGKTKLPPPPNGVVDMLYVMKIDGYYSTASNSYGYGVRKSNIVRPWNNNKSTGSKVPTSSKVSTLVSPPDLQQNPRMNQTPMKRCFNYMSIGNTRRIIDPK